MDDEHVDPKQLDAIAISQGPGSFTGIRIGMATAKGIAQVWGKKMIEVPTLAGFAHRDYDWIEYDKALIVPILDAKMHQIYAAAYEPFGKNAIVKDGVYDPNTFFDLLSAAASDYEVIYFFGDGLEAYKDYIDSFEPLHALAPENDRIQSAYGIAKLASQLLKNGKATTCYDAKPEYFRLPEAERKLKEKNEKQ